MLYVKAEGDYVRIVADDGRFLVRGALADLERRWLAHGFVRVHRSYLANLRRAVEIRPELGGGATVVLADGSEVPVARRQVARPAAEAADVSSADAIRPRRSGAPAAARSPPGARTPRDELADATAHGQVYLRRLRRAQLALSLLALVAFGALFGVLPLALYLLPAPAPHDAARGPGGPVGAGRAAARRCSWSSAGSTRGAPTRSTTASATSSSE